MSNDNTREQAIEVLAKKFYEDAGEDWSDVPDETKALYRRTVEDEVDALLAAGLLVGNPDNDKVMVDELQGRIMAAHKALHAGDLGEVEMFLSASFDGHIVSLSGMNIADIKALFALHDGFQLGVPESSREALPPDPEKTANALRAENGRVGIYTSNLVSMGADKPEPVVLVGEEDDGWWFYLPDTWPAEDWRGDVRWFAKDRGTFRPGGPS